MCHNKDTVQRPLKTVMCYMTMKSNIFESVFKHSMMWVAATWGGVTIKVREMSGISQWLESGHGDLHHAWYNVSDGEMLSAAAGWLRGWLGWSKTSWLLHEWLGREADSSDQLRCDTTKHWPANCPGVGLLHSPSITVCINIAAQSAHACDTLTTSEMW